MDTPLDALRAILSGSHGLGAHERLVLAALVMRRNRNGACFPGQRTIAADTGMSRPGVALVLGRLERAGVVERIGKPGRPTFYELHLDNLATANTTPARTRRGRPEVANGVSHLANGVSHLANGVSQGGQPGLPLVANGVSQNCSYAHELLLEGTAAPSGRGTGRSRKRSAKAKEPDPLATAANELVVQLDGLLRSHGVPGGIPSGQPWAKQVRIARQQLAECGHPPDAAAAALAWAFADGSDFLRKRLTGSGRMLALGDALGEWSQRDNAKGNGRRFRDQLSGQPENDPAGPWAQRGEPDDGEW